MDSSDLVGRDQQSPNGRETLLSLSDVAEIRGVHYMTVYRHVRTGRLPAVKVNGEWRVRSADARALRRPAGGVSGHADLPARLDGLEDRLLAADEPGAWAILENCLASGASPVKLHHELIVPVMRRIGDRWQAGQLEVGDEHAATAVMQRLVARLGPLMRSKGRSRGTIVVGAVAGDNHGLVTAIVADLLRHARFTVLDLGGNTPPESFAETVQTTDQITAVGVSTSGSADDKVRETIAAVRSVDAGIPVLVGGHGIRDASHAEALGADGTASGSRDIVPTFEQAISDAGHAPRTP